MEWTPIINCAYYAKITLGDEDGDKHILVTIQLKDFAGNNLTEIGKIHVYFTTDAAGLVQEEVNDAITISTYGIRHNIVTKQLIYLISEANGVIDFLVDGDNKDTYVNVILPNGRVVTSPVLEYSG